MAFIPLTALDIQVGKPVRKELWQKTLDNFNDHETRITDIEAAGARVVLFNYLVANLGQYTSGSTLEGIDYFVAPSDFVIITAEVTQLRAGTSGTFQIDVLVGNSPASMTTIFSTKPSLLFSAGNNATSNNAVISAPTVLEGQFVRLDVTLIQPGIGRVHINIAGEPS